MEDVVVGGVNQLPSSASVCSKGIRDSLSQTTS